MAQKASAKPSGKPSAKSSSKPAAASAPRTLSADAARRVVLAVQGLAGGTSAATLAAVLERHGFLRTLGGVEAYLAARARNPALTRAVVDAALAKRQALVLPAVRGCMYVVPKSAASLALQLADALSRARLERELQKAGVRAGEVEKLSRMVRDTLAAKGPLTADALRRALPEGSVRSLGEVGKKLGISSPLPAALRLMEFAGELERVVESGRLDSERYLWRVAAENLLAGAGAPKPAELYASIAAIFFRAAGIGTVADFAEWAGIGKRDAATAAATLPLIPVTVDGLEAEHLASPECEKLLAAPPALDGVVSFLPFEDNALALHGGPAFLTEPEHHGLEVPQWGPRGSATLAGGAHMSLRALVADGRMAGFWEYDAAKREIVTGLFAKVTAAARKRISAEAKTLAAFIADELGHGRSYSLDTDAAMAQRAALIRKL